MSSSHEALLEARDLRQTDHVIEFMGKSVMSIKKAFRDLCKTCGVKAITQSDTATVLWLSEQQAAQHVQRLHIERLLVTRRYR